MFKIQKPPRLVERRQRPWRVGCSNSQKKPAFLLNNKVRRSPGAKHCSSLCSQSEGANIVAARHELKIQQSHTPERWSCSLRVRGPHFASKVSYNAGAATDDYTGAAQISAARALPAKLDFLWIFNALLSRAEAILSALQSASSVFKSILRLPMPVSESGGRRGRICSQTRSSLLPDSVASAPRFACVCSRVRWQA